MCVRCDQGATHRVQHAEYTSINVVCLLVVADVVIGRRESFGERAAGHQH
eukprot:COSAG01_NODE_8112_length_2916_cov_1.794817_4_plen_50_part_00